MVDRITNVPIRRWILVIALVATIIKVSIAATTFGTNDVHYWSEFVRGAIDRGPVSIYGVDFEQALYNHGPLTSWMLVLIGHLEGLGLPLPFLIRLPASLADLATTVVLFELIRGVRGDRPAAAAAILFSLSPLALIVSGFHGNTDPVFVMLALLAVLALTSWGSGWIGGCAIGLALSVKVVPVVMLPLLGVIAFRCGRRVLRDFVLAGAVVFAVLWVPVLVLEPARFSANVLGYSGVPLRQWGLSQAFVFAGAPWQAVTTAGTDLRFLVVALAASLPAVLAWRRRPSEAVLVSGLPLSLLLALSPAFSMQYLVWGLAPGLLAVRLRVAALFVMFASAFAIVVYSLWNQGPPWLWYEARASPLPTAVLPLMLLTWLSLVRVCFVGMTMSTSHPSPASGRQLTDVD